jgi:NADPH:quinone reductase-like Zn-dependent oxidoreductase/ubiquinone/menaquinone biosynthesis C-methylase UbiE
MRIKVQVEELELTEVARDQDSTASEQAVRSICHELHWAVDPMLLNKGEMFSYCSQRRSNAPEPQEWYIDVRLMLLGFVNQTMESMRSAKQKPIPSMGKYAVWLQARLDEFWSSSRKISDQTQGHGSLPSGAELQKLAEHFESIDRRGAIGVLVARQLQKILIGEVEPLQILFADPEYLSDLYKELNTVGKAFPMLYAYLDAWVHKDPSLRFLEIGAGTGATTNMILDIIANSDQGPRYSEYMFTDVSNFFLPGALERFSAYDRVQYQTMDIEQDPEAQDFELDRYDFVVAANVLHTTKDLSITLANVRRLLKPHGKLILIEMTTPNNIETGFVWGSLPGWWLGSEDYRQLSAVIEEDRWDHLLKQWGFTGTEQVFRDWDSGVCHGWSIMVSSVAPDVNVGDAKQQADIGEDVIPNMTLIIDDEKSEVQIQTAKNLQYMLKCPDDSTGPRIATFDQISSRVHDLRTMHCVLLADLDRAHIQETNPTVFGLYQRILTGSKSVLWVQTHDERPDCAPYYAMVEGLCRVCRNENPFIKIVNLTLESVANSSTKRMASQIVKVLKAIDLNPNPDLRAHQLATEDQEYMEVSKYLCVSRLRQSKYLDEHIFTRTENPVQLRSFVSAFPVTLSIQIPGLLDTIEWVEDRVAYSPLPADHVEVEVRAIGVNLKYCLILLGRVNTDTLGTECAGYVKRVGSDVRGFKRGDRVAVGYLDTYKTLVRVKERYLVKIPDTMSFEDAAGVPTAFCTAYFCLYNVARLKEGESVLIHAAAGGTGQAAVQIAQHIGAEIFATVGSASKRNFLSEHYGIPEDHIFFSRDASFADGVKRMTNGRGVDVILNSLSGKLLVASWEIIAEFGRFIEIGRKDIDTRGFLPMFPFIKNASFTGVDLVGILDGAGQSNMYILQEVFDLIVSGVLRPSYPVQAYPIDQVEQAFRLLISGKSTGKIMLMPQQDAMIRVKESVDSDYRFFEHATYVIAGGLGGIGRQITRWMARRGATNILLLSRSGPDDNLERLRMIQDLEAQGVTLRYGVCDITNLESVQGAVQEAARSMPPIKGCFQAAMVIQVCLLAFE